MLVRHRHRRSRLYAQRMRYLITVCMTTETSSKGILGIQMGKHMALLNLSYLIKIFLSAIFICILLRKHTGEKGKRCENKL